MCGAIVLELHRAANLAHVLNKTGSSHAPVARHPVGMQLAPLQYRPGQMVVLAPGGCWVCVHFHGELVAGGVHVVCEREAPIVGVIAAPAAGCAFWSREPGSD
jgi:hypothetical protein